MSEYEIKQRKVYGKTAIPEGYYNVDLNRKSPKYSDFKRYPWAKPYNGEIPHIQNVMGYEGILIHVGNTDADTSGCILVGENKEVGKVLNSTNTFHKLMTELNKAKEKGELVTLVIK